MSPPKLTGNTPVFDIFEPVEINLVEPFRNKLRLAAANGINCRLCQWLHLYKPLLGNSRFYGCSAAIASADIVVIIFDFNQCPFCFQIGNNGFPCFVTIHAGILRIIVCNFCIVSHNIDDWQVMPQTNFKVVRVVGWGNLYNACSEVHFYIVIGNNRNFPMYQRQNQSLANQMLIPFIIRVDCNGRITQQGFWTGGCQFQIAAAILQRIPQVPEMTCLVFIFDFCIGNGSQAFRTPVNNPFAPINQAFFIVANEYFLDCLIAAFIHGEPFPFPVTGRA